MDYSDREWFSAAFHQFFTTYIGPLRTQFKSFIVVSMVYIKVCVVYGKNMV